MTKKIVVEFNEDCLNDERGVLFEVEGADASGKASNIELLQEMLERMGHEVVVYHFPEYDTPTGKMIAKYLTGDYGDLTLEQKELVSVLYASDRAKQIQDINMYLDNGAIVLMDRYTYSNVYSIAEYPKEQWDERMDWIENLEFNCMQIPKPDYVFFLHVDPEISIQRSKERGIEEYQNGKEDINENNFELIKKVSECYNYFCDKKDNWIKIDEMENGKQLPLDKVFSKLILSVCNILTKQQENI